MNGRVLGAGLLCSLVVVPSAAAGPWKGKPVKGNAGADHKVALCHATHSASNPYVHIVVDLHAWDSNPRLRGHRHHPNDFLDVDGDCVTDEPPTAGECDGLSLYIDGIATNFIPTLPIGVAGAQVTLEFEDAALAGDGVQSSVIATITTLDGQSVEAVGDEIGDTGVFVVPIAGGAAVCQVEASNPFLMVCDDGFDTLEAQSEDVDIAVLTDPPNPECELTAFVGS